MKFRPLHDRVVIKRIDAEEKSAGGIIIPDTAKEKPSQGEVIAVGPGGRDEQGRILPNKNFGDMKALADYVHSKGLKFGIYSSPGPETCAGFTGSYQHEEQDAQTYADWGVDYLKYDWCSASQVYPVSQIREVYKKMRDALKKAGRPIIYSLCEYGWDLVWRWGADVGGNLWRTTGDIQDRYDSMATIGFGQAGQRQVVRGHRTLQVTGESGHASSAAAGRAWFAGTPGPEPGACACQPVR